MTARTRQIGAAIVPTGCECGPAATDSTSRIVVSGNPSAWKVLASQDAFAAATAGDAASAADKTSACLFTASPRVSGAGEHTRGGMLELTRPGNEAMTRACELSETSQFALAPETLT